jgi:hypothetical protein
MPLRALAVAIGIAWSVAFVLVGLRHDLQMYGDGSIFAYAVAAQDAWTFHWHNISGRAFVYLLAHLPAETYVGLTGDARGGIGLHGLLFFSAPLAGLALTYAADRSKGRLIFVYACLSTACLCPFVFGFPTEMWVAHAVFWPTLAISHYARDGRAGYVAIAGGFTALVLTHGGGVVLAATILASTALRGLRGPVLRRTAGAFVIAMAVWALMLLTFRPDPYIAKVITTAAFSFIDLRNLLAPAAILMLVAVLSFVAASMMAHHLVTTRHAPVAAFALVMAGLAAYWLRFDHSLLADYRYPLRTALLVGTPIFGLLAVAYALRSDGDLRVPGPLLPRALAALEWAVAPRHLICVLLIILAVHVVETAKFVGAWNDYTGAVRTLAMGQAADPALGDARFVSSDRIDAARNRLSWSSTAHFLSVLVAPALAPLRLVVSPDPGYWWLSCKTASASQQTSRAVPLESRRLIRAYACAQ